MEHYYQQGDVLIKAITTMDKKLDKLKPLKTNIVEEGEATGHAHRIVSDPSTYNIFKVGNSKYIRSSKVIELRHEEHKPVKIPPGTYRIEGVREFDHFKQEERRVVD